MTTPPGRNSTEPVAARLDTGFAGEPAGGQPSCPGGPGQRDQLQSIEDLEGTKEGDFFYGDAGSNQLLGHFGADSYFALGGEDTILANSADSDLVIDCGGNAGDTAFIDHPTAKYQDPPPVGCETIYEADPNSFRPPTAPTGPGLTPVAPSTPPKVKEARSHRTGNQAPAPPREDLLHREPAAARLLRLRLERGRLDLPLQARPRPLQAMPLTAPATGLRRAGMPSASSPIDRAGNRDRTPAVFSFLIRRR